MRKTLRTAKGQSCIKCGTNDGTIVSAHYCGPMQHRLGSGKGLKANDLATAHLCHSCHAEFDQYLTVTAKPGTVEHRIQELERSELFLALVIQTRIRDAE